jgi:hypothetical protein
MTQLITKYVSAGHPTATSTDRLTCRCYISKAKQIIIDRSGYPFAPEHDHARLTRSLCEELLFILRCWPPQAVAVNGRTVLGKGELTPSYARDVDYLFIGSTCTCQSGGLRVIGWSKISRIWTSTSESRQYMLLVLYLLLTNHDEPVNKSYWTCSPYSATSRPGPWLLQSGLLDSRSIHYGV